MQQARYNTANREQLTGDALLSCGIISNGYLITIMLA